MKLDCDIAIIGSGAAGGVLASTLAEKTDKKIILLEKGGFYKGPTFVQEELGARHLFSDKGTRGCKDGSMPVRGGECVGGGTTVNVALCFNPVESVWNRWRGVAELQRWILSTLSSLQEQIVNIKNLTLLN